MEANRNPIGWVEIYVSDMARAKSFYEAVLGTTLESVKPPDDVDMEMAFFSGETENAGCGGALVKSAYIQPGGGGTLVYFSSSDCAVEQAKVEQAGGKVVQAKFPIGEFGFCCICSDSEGNIIGFHSMQ